MTELTNLSTDIWSSVQSEWIELSDVCRFDTSLCNSQNRQQVLLTNRSVYGSRSIVIDDRIYSWLINKRFDLRNFCADPHAVYYKNLSENRAFASQLLFFKLHSWYDFGSLPSLIEIVWSAENLVEMKSFKMF